MVQFEIGIFKNGKQVGRVRCPILHRDGGHYVEYNERLWPLTNGRLHLDIVEATDEQAASDAIDRKGQQVAEELHAAAPALIPWDRSQRQVIDAPHTDRLLIDAGPGMGKTAVACARVSQLIDQHGLEPSRVWIISFTRTAVREIRDRIATYLEDASAAFAVRIATLDSHAWAIHSGFDDEAKILGSYEENIARVLELVQLDESVADYLDGVEHLVVDEAQDIVGTRSDLVVELIRNLSSSCGVTVFADEAQAIYGFADDREVRPGEVREALFTDRIRTGAAGPFRECELAEVHRTGSRRLLTIFSETRRKVLATAGEATDKLMEIRDEITSLKHGEAPRVDDAALAELEDAFILYRRRCDVLLASSILAQNGVLHRVRMSGLPMSLEPWIGAALSEHTEPDLSRSAFEASWVDNVYGTSLATREPEDAWASLVRMAGRTQTVVNMRLLRQRLGRKRPPAELCHTELGLCGPIVGTIHASKGREADTVHLMLPEKRSQNIDQDEEARVLFVGATRGRSRLLIGDSYRQYATRLEASGRTYSLKTKSGKAAAQVEIGRDTDIAAEGLAGRSLFADPDAVRTSQARIASFANRYVSLVANSDREAGFAYRLREGGMGQCLAVLSQRVNSDLFAVADAVQTKLGGGRRRPPDTIRHLHAHGVCTMVLPPDAHEEETLHEPWRSSGITLAPLVLGYSTVFFPYSNMRWRR